MVAFYFREWPQPRYTKRERGTATFKFPRSPSILGQ